MQITVQISRMHANGISANIAADLLGLRKRDVRRAYKALGDLKRADGYGDNRAIVASDVDREEALFIAKETDTILIASDHSVCGEYARKPQIRKPKMHRFFGESAVRTHAGESSIVEVCPVCHKRKLPGDCANCGIERMKRRLAETANDFRVTTRVAPV